jgi:hypothetical protein
VNAKHNPWHGGDLNGGDIERLLAQVERIFLLLSSLPSKNSEFSDKLKLTKVVWDAFAIVVPLLRSTILLEPTESTYLLAYIKEFGELFQKNTTKNPTPNMHSIVAHMAAPLEKYGTVDLFAEDSLVVINSLVNCVIAAFQSLDGERQII